MRIRTLTVLFLCLLLASTATADKTVTMTFTGDVTLGGENSVQKRAGSFTDYYNNFGADYFFANVRSLFEDDDITVINLECVLADSSSGENTSKTYRFRAPTDFVSVLTGSSIELATLSNNHVGDFGSGGLQSTKDTLDAAGIPWCNLLNTWIWEQDGIRIGFVSTWNDELVSENYSGRIYKQIAALKADGCNAVVVSVHLGQEYAKRHVTAQGNVSRKAVAAGADLVIMHHPHVLEGCDIINNRYVFYSLGNFCFGGNNLCDGGPNHLRALDSVIVRCTFTFSDEGEYMGQQVSLYPCYTSSTYPDNNFQPTLLTGTDALEVLKLIQYDTTFTLEPFDETLGCVTQPYLPADGGALPDDGTVMPSAAQE